MSAAAVGDGKFVFWGFLDAKSSVRKKQLEQIKNYPLPVVLYESPHRLLLALRDIEQVCGEKTGIIVARELTKIYEEYFFGNVSDVIAEFEKREVRGEFVLILECVQEKEEFSDSEIRGMLDECIANHMTKKRRCSGISPSVFVCPKIKFTKFL